MIHRLVGLKPRVLKKGEHYGVRLRVRREVKSSGLAMGTEGNSILLMAQYVVRHGANTMISEQHEGTE